MPTRPRLPRSRGAVDVPTPRAPQQERGQRRVGAILDAAAALIAEEGVAAVSMHGVARRSGTTTGSMYHFFPDRETLLGALAERHACALRALGAEIEQDLAARPPDTTDQAVGRLLDPLLDYGDRHPDLLPLTRFARTTEWGGERDAGLGRLVARLAEQVVASRNPGVAAPERAVRAAMMAAMLDGVGSVVARTPCASRDGASARALRRELRRALVAYLDAHAEPRAPRAPRRAAARRSVP